MKFTSKNLISLYRHYKNKPYQYLGEVIHSETQEELVLYKTRYKNDSSSFWVRPKKMFFDDVEINNVKQKRFQKIEIKMETFNNVTVEIINALVTTFNDVLPSLNTETIKNRLSQYNEVLLICAFDDKKLIGFKLGYTINRETLYSWLGAVLPDYRGVGIGQSLIQEQERWCLANDIEKISTKTLNKWKTMLILNIKNGYEVKETQITTENEIKILLEKNLTLSKT